jgi:hypothetical protein
VSRAQREKGKRGERMAAKAIEAVLKVRCRRGVQYQGGQDSADLKIDMPGIHFECKFVEREQVRAWMRQASSECGDNVPVVVHKRSREPWLVTLPLERVNEFAARLSAASGQSIQEVGTGHVPGPVPG